MLNISHLSLTREKKHGVFLKTVFTISSQKTYAGR